MTNEELKNYCDEYLEVNFETGKVYWKKLPVKNHVKIGDRAGHIDKRGYRIIKVNNKQIKEHRLIWFLYYGYMPEYEIDHIDRNKINNAIHNLRHVSRSCNMQNQKVRSDNTTGFVGVFYSKRNKKYQGQIRIHTKPVHLGFYNCRIESAYARAAAEILLEDWHCNEQQTIFKQISNVDPTFNYDRFKHDIETYGFEFSSKRYPI